MTHETFVNFEIAAALVWSVVYVWRRRASEPGLALAVLDVALPFLLLAMVAWSLFNYVPTEGPPKPSDYVIGFLAGIGWWHILQWLAWPSFKLSYCRSCWWALDNGRCANVDALGCDPARGSFIDDFHVHKCLRRGGHRSRQADFRILGIKGS